MLEFFIGRRGFRYLLYLFCERQVSGHLYILVFLSPNNPKESLLGNFFIVWREIKRVMHLMVLLMQEQMNCVSFLGHDYLCSGASNGTLLFGVSPINDVFSAFNEYFSGINGFCVIFYLI